MCDGALLQQRWGSTLGGMPRWAFTKTMRDTRPFGLPSAQLEAGKVFTDPVHGDVRLTEFEMKLVNSRPFQRLRRVRQLGNAQLVYYGASQTRFSHSLGAVQAVQDLLDLAVDQGEGPHGLPDLIEQWRDDGTFDRNLARATILARLGALLHDICHIPFGHSIEDEMGILEPHDDNEARLERLWGEFDDELIELLEPLRQDLLPFIAPGLAAKRRGAEIGEEVTKEGLIDRLEYPFVADLVGNTICADLLDYLARDHLYTGLPMALGHRFLSSFFITPVGERKYYRGRMALNVTRNGRERTDVVSELLKYLRYRYELTERVLAHHAKLRADAMVGKMLLLWRDQLIEETGSDPDDVAGDHKAAVKALKEIEQEMLRHGDDGLLEYLAERGREDAAWRWATISRLADGVQNRKLYTEAGRCGTTDAPAHKLWSEYKEAPKRLGLEREIADYVGIPVWKLAIWLPPEEMGLKVARVLVFDGSTVLPFNEYEQKGRRRGEEIDQAHRDLWAISIYVDESVPESTREEIRVRLAQLHGIRWEHMSESYETEMERWPDELAARRVARARCRERDHAELLKSADVVQARSPKERAATFAATQRYFETLAERLGWEAPGDG